MQPTLPSPQVALPTCIPTTYSAGGHYCLAYPRSPFNRHRYLVVRCPSPTAPGTDLECVHDDFGNLVPMRERQVDSDWSTAVSWRPVQ